MLFLPQLLCLHRPTEYFKMFDVESLEPSGLYTIADSLPVSTNPGLT